MKSRIEKVSRVNAHQLDTKLLISLNKVIVLFLKKFPGVPIFFKSIVILGKML